MKPTTIETGTPAAPTPPAPATTPVRVASERQHARVAVLGASGYAGQEFARFAAQHPGVTLVVLASREHAGRPAAEMLPGVDPRGEVLPTVADPGQLAAMADRGAFDTLVLALPHGAWTRLAIEEPTLASAPERIIDLSSDHRDGTGGYVYGLPETQREAIVTATRVANPGCYPTVATLALLPAAEMGWICGPVMVSALSGVSGAGRTPALRTSFVELEGGATLYKAGSVHQHVPEMERNLAALGAQVPIGFAPQLAPMARGILLTATTQLDVPVSPEEAWNVYAERYADERFVRVLPASAWPETRAVRASNRCDVAVTTLHGGRTLLAAAAIDNLVKGAAGQALQNLNLMTGWPEDWALPVHGTPW
ncbi:MAG: N-acetyl-gamma-glutamyl-phosphate reductase [Candidatus Eisenbacteria bacterium]